MFVHYQWVILWVIERPSKFSNRVFMLDLGGVIFHATLPAECLHQDKVPQFPHPVG